MEICGIPQGIVLGLLNWNVVLNKAELEINENEKVKYELVTKRIVWFSFETTSFTNVTRI